MNKLIILSLFGFALIVISCQLPKPPEKDIIKQKHNCIVLLDLSDRIIVQENQPARDVELIKHLYSLFEEKVRKDLYIKSRDEIKVVIAPQKGSDLPTYKYEDRLYVNMDGIPIVTRKKKELQRREEFFANLDTLYKEAEFSNDPIEYYGADIWKYFYEDLRHDISDDTLTTNYLIILTDGYPIVGKDRTKLRPIKDEFPDLKVVLVEAAPRDEEMEWDNIMEMWGEWFNEIGIRDYTLIKRMAISKEKEQLSDILSQ